MLMSSRNHERRREISAILARFTREASCGQTCSGSIEYHEVEETIASHSQRDDVSPALHRSEAGIQLAIPSPVDALFGRQPDSRLKLPAVSPLDHTHQD